MGALATKAKDEAALDATTIEAEVVRSTITEENAEVLTIESSLEWGGTLIEEEKEDAEIGEIPSTSAANLEIPTPRKKRKRSKEELQAPLLIRRKRTRSVTVAEAARERWETLEAQIEFPILRTKGNDAP